MTFWQYITVNQQQIIVLLLEHIQLTAISVGMAILIGVPLGILISYRKGLNKPILGAANIIQAIPSMALLGFMIPFLGIGTIPSVATVILYSLLPIIKNTYTGIENINPLTLEAAKGIGLTPWQVLTKVQIPLALPVIMAGVRISAVTAVGLMTIAAFIGAGGLGFLVFSGIRTVNNNQILAGALPACLLALFVDFLVGTVEKIVTPPGMTIMQKEGKTNSRKLQKSILAVTAVALCLLFAVTFIGGLEKQENTVIIGSKDFTEQHVLAHMVAELLENRTDLSVDRRINLGGTQVCFTALKSGDIDLYVEYSGTAYGDTLGHPPISDTLQVYQTVKEEFKEKYNIEVLPQMQFNNTYTLAVPSDIANQYGLKKFSDLRPYAAKLRSGSTLEFLNREDGLPGLQKAYGFAFGNSLGLDGSQRYLAIANNEVDIIDAFSTDGLLKKFALIVLEDDLHFFPPYYAMPIVRTEVLEEYPEIAPVLAELGQLLTQETMIDLNHQVDVLQMEPLAVAQKFLKDSGLLL